MPTGWAADLRLAELWRAQEYYGAKPGQQTGSALLDDLRSYSAPLPSLPGSGGSEACARIAVSLSA